MTDIVERLPDVIEIMRKEAHRSPRIGLAYACLSEAADEIERLRAEKSQLHGALQLANRNYADARSAALEEAAKVAEEGGTVDGDWIAGNIRALKEKS